VREGRNTREQIGGHIEKNLEMYLEGDTASKPWKQTDNLGGGKYTPLLWFFKLKNGGLSSSSIINKKISEGEYNEEK